MQLIYILWRRTSVLWNRQQEHTTGGRQTWQRSLFCLMALIQIPLLPWLLLHYLEMSRPSSPSRMFPADFSALLWMYFPNDPVEACLFPGVELSNGFSRLWDRLLVHGTTHFSISSNPVFHFSESEKKVLKAEVARVYWMQNYPFSARTYSLQ